MFLYAELKGEKRSLENGLEMDSDKRMKVEEKLTGLEKTIKINKIAYKGKFKQLVKKIAQLKTNKTR